VLVASIAYFPPIEFFARAISKNHLILEAHEHYIKQTYRNRMCIASAQGKLDLIIPVNCPQGSKTNITNVLISYDEAWHKKHWHAITSAYKSTPFFDYYADEFYVFYKHKHTDLWSFTTAIIDMCFNLLSTQIKIEKTQTFIHTYPQTTSDCRYTLHPKKEYNKCHFSPYIQLFEEKHGFIPNLSILDILCNLGPESLLYIKNIAKNIYT